MEDLHCVKKVSARREREEEEEETEGEKQKRSGDKRATSAEDIMTPIQRK